MKHPLSVKSGCRASDSILWRGYARCFTSPALNIGHQRAGSYSHLCKAKVGSSLATECGVLRHRNEAIRASLRRKAAR